MTDDTLTRIVAIVMIIAAIIMGLSACESEPTELEISGTYDGYWEFVADTGDIYQFCPTAIEGYNRVPEGRIEVMFEKGTPVAWCTID
jgi:hypothetical protein